MIKKEQIVEVMQKDGGPMTVRDVAAMLGEEESATDKVMREMRAEGYFGPLTFNHASQREYVLASKLPAAAIPAPAPSADTRPAFKDLDYDGVHDRILESIDALACTLNQIKRHAGFAPGDDIADVLDAMIQDKEIERVNNGTITAYFRKGIVPERFWPNGDVLGAEWGTMMPPTPKAPAASDATMNVAIAPHEGGEPLAFSSGPPTSDKVYGRGKTQFELSMVEAAAELCGTFSGTARHLGYKGDNPFRVMCNKHPEVMEAFERGKAKHAGSVRPARSAKAEPQVADIVADLNSDTPAQQSGAVEPDYRPLQEGDLPVLDEIIEPEATADRRFHLLHKLWTQAVGAAGYDKHEWQELAGILDGLPEPVEMASTFETKKSAADPGESLARGAKSEIPPVSSKSYTFQQGGQVLVGFEGDLFETTHKERAFLHRLATLFNSFDPTQPGQYGVETPDLPDDIWTPKTKKKGPIARLIEWSQRA